MTRALRDEGVTSLVISIVADLSELGDDEFWGEIEGRSCAHPFDGEGRRREYRDIPKSVGELTDDPLRSLAGALKRAGGYVKDKAPFSEFRWADFLRGHISAEMVQSDFETALALARNLAPSPEAAALPGWRGSLPHAVIGTVQATS